MKNVTPQILKTIESPSAYKQLIAKDSAHLGKARGILVIKNYVFKNGKKDTAVVFTKKSNTAKEVFKELKSGKDAAATKYPTSQLLLGQCALTEGKLQIKILDGGLSGEAMQKEAKEIFTKLAVSVQVGDFQIVEDENETEEDSSEGTPAKVSTGAVSSTLSGSVGRGGDNKPEDVRAVQTLLNKQGAGLTVDGGCGKKTIAAIDQYQTQKLGMSVPDGLISPNGKTWRSLTGGGGGNNEQQPVPPAPPAPQPEPKPEPQPQPNNPPAPVANTINGSVGRGGANDLEDVKCVQTLLNKRGAKLVVDGACGKMSIATIELLQKKLGMNPPTGIIEPNSATWTALVSGNIPKDTNPQPNPQPKPQPKPTFDPALWGDGKIERGALPSDFARMKDKEVTKEHSEAAKHYLKVLCASIPAAERKASYNKSYIRFTTSAGMECLANFEEHTIYGADLNKPRVPHPSVGLFRKK